MSGVPTTCLILAGGLGTRLAGLLPDLPKCLAPVGDRPFLQWQIDSLRQRGVREFALALGFRAGQVRAAIETMELDPAPRCVQEAAPLGTGGAIRHAMQALGLDELLVVNGDTYVGGRLDALLEPLDLSGGESARIAVVPVPDRARFGGIDVDAGQGVTAFLEKGQAGPGLINAGLYRLHRRAFDALDADAGESFSVETAVLPRLVARGAVRAVELPGPFIDIGVPDDYLLFCQEYAVQPARGA